MSLNNLTTRNIPIAVVVAIFVAMAAAGCGSASNGGEVGVARSDSASSGGEVGDTRIVDNDRIYVIGDLKDAFGVKGFKDYDVEELPGALEAWKVIYNQLDYEARFYPTHEDAVEQGILYADSITGDDAVVVGDEVLWEEGEKDRKKCSRASGTPHSGCSYSARYLEYVIRGNMILFCEGNDSQQAFTNCENLLTLTDPV